MKMQNKSRQNINIKGNVSIEGILWPVAVLLFVVILGVTIYILTKSAEPPTDPFADLEGQVYLSMAKKTGSREGKNFADFEEYILDIKSGNVKPAIPNDFTLKITSGVSPDGSTLAYMSTPYDGNAPADYFYPATEISQLYTYNFNTGEKKRITDDEEIGKRGPEWSPDGTKVAYYTADRESYINNRVLDPGVWRIQVVDTTTGDITPIGNGVQPFWSPDGNYILYSATDGLYVYNFSNGQTENVYDFKGVPLTTFMKFDLSNDGSLFAISDPEGDVWKNIWSEGAGTLLYEIVSWEPFAINYMDGIVMQGQAGIYWPSFSPDNRFVLYQRADYRPSTNEEFVGFQLFVYDIESKARKSLFNMDQYRFDASFVNDWVY